MRTWKDLYNLLVELFGSTNVYFQPPESVKMVYPCIRFSEAGMDIKRADDIAYLKSTRYELTVISKTPAPPVIEKLLDIPNCTYDRPYKMNNLYHYVFTLYY